jgi:heme exporter protein CcmD
MIDWLAMGGHGFFIWSSYGMLAIAIAIELLVLRNTRRRAFERARQARSEQELSP